MYPFSSRKYFTKSLSSCLQNLKWFASKCFEKVIAESSFCSSLCWLSWMFVSMLASEAAINIAMTSASVMNSFFMVLLFDFKFISVFQTIDRFTPAL